STLAKEDVLLYAFMKAKNPGIAALAEDILIAKLSDFSQLETFIEETKPDFAVIGPENPLAAGIVDFLKTNGIPSIGPTKNAAKIESSKSFTRELMKKYDIPGLPEFKIYERISDEEDFREYVQSLGKVAVKRDGLAGGKGVKLMGEHLKTIDEVFDYCDEVFQLGEAVVIEELLEGEEFSLQCFVSDEKLIPMPIVQDHKRAYEDDEGPNTGGMGSYSDATHLLPFIPEEIVDEALAIMQQTVTALKKETNIEYCGILYGGFILTSKGLKLLEFNARFGDPEAMNVLPILETSLVEIFQAMLEKRLGEISATFKEQATVCKYLVPKGYPVSPEGNKPVEIDRQGIENSDVKLFFSSVKENKSGEIITTTSRAIALVGIEDDLSTAEKKAEFATQFVKGTLFHRKDIGTSTLIQQRIEHLKELGVL
ncbi:MAG: phosphoribosylamine--glycine ligase, partial [Asgard group archaeon]|nr:phosphoribosylamine--glycine ligase [Asgard group archaeon]